MKTAPATVSDQDASEKVIIIFFRSHGHKALTSALVGSVYNATWWGWGYFYPHSNLGNY